MFSKILFKFILLLSFYVLLVICQDIKKIKIKKDIRDYTDAEIEKIYDQWEDSDSDELEEDELPEWKRKPPSIDLTKLDFSQPEKVLEATKKGKTLMMFATVAGSPSATEVERISSLWQQGLFNGHIDAQRYIVGDNRVLFVLSDGAYAWKAKDFLVAMETCEAVTLEGKEYMGRGGDGGEKGKRKKEKRGKKTEL